MTFDEHLRITGTRPDGRRLDISAPCRFIDDGVSDDVHEGATAGTHVDMGTFFIRMLDIQPKDRPQVGDEVRFGDFGRLYRVGRVSRLGDCIVLAARGR